MLVEEVYIPCYCVFCIPCPMDVTWLDVLQWYTVVVFYVGWYSGTWCYCICTLRWYIVLPYIVDQYTVLLQCYIDRPDQHTSSLWPVLPKYTFTSNEFTILILISSNRILAEKKLQKNEFFGQLSQLSVARETKSN